MMNKADTLINQTGQPKPYANRNVAAAFFYLYAILFFIWGFVNEYCLAILFDAAAVHPITIYQCAAFVICIVCAVMGWMMQKYSAPKLCCAKGFIHAQLIVSALVIPVLVLEMVLNPFYDMPEKDVSIFRKDEQLGWRLKPNIHERYGGIPVRVNSLGLRGDEIANPKPDDAKRILFLGDSVTFGLRIEDETKTLPAQTSHFIESENDISIDSVNAGVPGYNTYQEYVYLRDNGLALQPDLVVLCFVLNDVVNTYTQHKYNDYGADSPIAFLAESPIDQWLQHSSIAHAVQYWKSEWRSRYYSRENAVYEELFSAQVLIDRAAHPDIQAAWKITQNYLREIHDLCDEQNIPFLLVIAPYRFQYKELQGNTIPQEVLRSFAIEHGIQYLDLLTALLEYKEQVDDDPDKIFQDDCHFTELGIEQCARQIAQTMIERKMLEAIISTEE